MALLKRSADSHDSGGEEVELARLGKPVTKQNAICSFSFFFFCSLFFSLASAISPKVIVMNQGPKDKDCLPLVHLLFRNRA